MKKLNERKAIKLKKLLANVSIEDIKEGETFYYLDYVYTNAVNAKKEPKCSELDINYFMEPIGDSYNIYKFVKTSNDEAKEVVTGETFKFYNDSKKVDYRNPNYLIDRQHDRSIYIAPSAIFKGSNIIAKLIYQLFAEKDYKKMKSDIHKFICAADYRSQCYKSCVFNLICPSEFEQEFYIQNRGALTFYDEEPKVGEYFGYAGNISCIVPKVDHKDDSKYFDTMEGLIVHPLLFKRISEPDAIEVTSGIVFHFKSLLSTDVSYDNEYKNSPLSIDPICYIKFTDKYKEIYGKAISDFEKFSKRMSNTLSDAKKIYAKKMDECENTYRSSLSDAYDVARVDNAIFDLEKQSSATEPRVHKLIKEISTVTSDFD